MKILTSYKIYLASRNLPSKTLTDIEKFVETILTACAYFKTILKIHRFYNNKI